MTYDELRRVLLEHNNTHPEEKLTVHIIFTEDSFNEKLPLPSRTYRTSSDEKAFMPGMGGYSIFGSCLDGTDNGVRLDRYMAEAGWKVQDCYVLERMRDTAAIQNVQRTVQGDSTVCYFFGDTCIQARESQENSKVRLEPVSGNQTACGEWLDLPIDRVHGYCTLLERYLNER